MGKSAGRTATASLLVGLVLLSIGLAGCLGSSGQPEEAAGSDEDNATEDPANRTNNSTIEVDEETEFDPDSTVHVHDLWQDRTEVTIIDGKTVETRWGEWTAECATTASCHQVPAYLVDVPVEDDQRNVYPGTGSIDVTLDWESQGLEDSFDGFSPKVCVSNRAFVPDCETESLATNATHVYAEPGETWTISDRDVINHRTVDPPHSQKSNWRFLILPCSSRSDSGQCSPQLAPNVGASQFTLTVTIDRGDQELPVDPPHFAFYGNASEVEVLNGYEVADGPVKSTHGPWMTGTTQDGSRELWRVGGAQIKAGVERGQGGTPVIPIETRQVVVTLSWESGTDVPLDLGYRTAADNWQAPWQVPDSGSECGDRCVQYTIPVETGQTDSPYAHRTQWEFGIFHDGDTPKPMTEYNVSLGITAAREVTS